MAKKVKKNSGEMDVAKSVRDSQVEVVGIDEIVAYETNPRIHEDLQVEKVANSIKRFGFVAPIIVDENNVIVAGHGRHAAARLLGLTEVPIVRKKFPPGGAEAYRIADNELTDQSSWDMELLRDEVLKLIEEYQYTPDDIITTIGFPDWEVDTILSSMPKQEDLDENDEREKSCEKVDPFRVDESDSILLYFNSREDWMECFRLLGGMAGVPDPSVKQRKLLITADKMEQLRGMVE